MVAYRKQKSDVTAREIYDALQQVIQEIANRVEEIGSWDHDREQRRCR
jgi:hypothetical protein